MFTYAWTHNILFWNVQLNTGKYLSDLTVIDNNIDVNINKLRLLVSLKYPTVEQQRNFLTAYVSERAVFKGIPFDVADVDMLLLSVSR